MHLNMYAPPPSPPVPPPPSFSKGVHAATIRLSRIRGAESGINDRRFRGTPEAYPLEVVQDVEACRDGLRTDNHPVALVHEHPLLPHHVGQLVALRVVQHQARVGVTHVILLCDGQCVGPIRSTHLTKMYLTEPVSHRRPCDPGAPNTNTPHMKALICWSALHQGHLGFHAAPGFKAPGLRCCRKLDWSGATEWLTGCLGSVRED